MFDGDGDRLGCVDSDGIMIPGDGQLAIIFDQYIE
jgi:phosphomannomutase